MKGVPLLSMRHLAANPGVSLMLVLCLALTVFVPTATALLAQRYERSLHARSDATPFVVGAPGSRFDLVLGALYFRPSDIRPVPAAVLDDLQASEGLLAIPLHVEHAAQGEPVVGTSIDYLQWRHLVAAEGRLPTTMGDAVLGQTVAKRLGLGPGDTIYTDQPDLYDISKPPSIELTITGVLHPTGSPDDDVIFVDMRTTWLMDGHYHGHREASTITDPDLLIGRTDEHVALSGALVEANRVSAENLQRFHLHGDPATLPLTAIIVDPSAVKAGTIAKARLNAGSTAQMVEPRLIVDELLRFVFRVKSMLDALSVALAVCTVGLGVLVLTLSLRLRRTEIETLHRMGCGRHTVPLLCGGEIALLVGAGVFMAIVAVAVTIRLAPELVSFL